MFKARKEPAGATNIQTHPLLQRWQITIAEAMLGFCLNEVSTLHLILLGGMLSATELFYYYQIGPFHE